MKKYYPVCVVLLALASCTSQVDSPASPGASEGASQGTSQDASPGTSQGASQGTSQDASPGTTQDASPGASQDASPSSIFPSSGTIGVLTQSFDELDIKVNIDGKYDNNNVYMLQLTGTSAYLYFNKNPRVELSADAIKSIQSAIFATSFHTRKRTPPGLAVDGAPLAPTIVLSTEAVDFKFTVSDSDKYLSDHSGSGLAISCAAYQELMKQVTAPLNIQSSFDCQDYW